MTTYFIQPRPFNRQEYSRIEEGRERERENEADVGRSAGAVRAVECSGHACNRLGDAKKRLQVYRMPSP